MARFCKFESVKASLAIKIETVKPIPAELPVAKISRHLTVPDNAPTFVLMATKLKAKIPKGFPATSPAKIAQEAENLVPPANFAKKLLFQNLQMQRVERSKRLSRDVFGAKAIQRRRQSF